MKKWEYLLHEIDLNQQEINKLGEKGWELVHEHYAPRIGYVYTFKREKK